MDKIADMLSNIQNAQKRGKSFTLISYSKMTKNILNVLFIEGFIKGYKEHSFVSNINSQVYPVLCSASKTFESLQTRTSHSSTLLMNQDLKFQKKHVLIVELGYNQGSLHQNPTINESPCHKIIRISRPGKRIYLQSKDINKVKRGLGILLISTSKGILSDRDARFFQLGGEALCQIY